MLSCAPWCSCDLGKAAPSLVNTDPLEAAEFFSFIWILRVLGKMELKGINLATQTFEIHACVFIMPIMNLLKIPHTSSSPYIVFIGSTINYRYTFSV